MKALTKRTDAIRACLEQRSFSIASLRKEDVNPGVHSDPCYELYFSISGALSMLIDEKTYRVESGDLFFIGPHVSRQVLRTDPLLPHERISIFIFPAYLNSLSSPHTDLSSCFSVHRPASFTHRLHLSVWEQKRFIYYINRIASSQGFGKDLIEQYSLAELLIFLTHLRSETGGGYLSELKQPEFHVKVNEILAYIHQNLDGPLPIQSIASHFYLSTSYLCRLFKKGMGTTINDYITTKRIDLAKLLLADGRSASEVYSLCGFNDYSNFYKAFKKKVGISPKGYSQNSLL